MMGRVGEGQSSGQWVKSGRFPLCSIEVPRLPTTSSVAETDDRFGHDNHRPIFMTNLQMGPIWHRWTGIN